MPRTDIIRAQRAVLELQLAALTKNRFKTNSIVQIDEHIGVRINGTPVPGLRTQDFTILCFLARHALAFPGAPLSVDEIIRSLGEELPRLAPLGMSWVDPHAKAIHRATHRLRLALKKQLQDPALVESVDGRKGYRLSTPAMNVWITGYQGGSGELTTQPVPAPRLPKRVLGGRISDR